MEELKDIKIAFENLFDFHKSGEEIDIKILNFDRKDYEQSLVSLTSTKKALQLVYELLTSEIDLVIKKIYQLNFFQDLQQIKYQD